MDKSVGRHLGFVGKRAALLIMNGDVKIVRVEADPSKCGETSGADFFAEVERFLKSNN